MSSPHEPRLILTSPTDEERLRSWTATHPQWGNALTLEGYIGREQRQLDIPLARNGGLSNWILTEDEQPDGSYVNNDGGDESAAGKPGQPRRRPVLSSCETLKKRVLVKGPDGKVREGTAHGVASVFTDPKFRGKGYAKLMMKRLAENFSEVNRKQPSAALLSVLYSDIGKEFYAVNGWLPYQSDHIQFLAGDASTTITTKEPVSGFLKNISFDDLPPLAVADEKIIREQVAVASPEGKPAVRAALLPDLDHIHWHLKREGFVTEQLFGRSPAVHGALYTAAKGLRVWAVWTRSYSGTVDQPEKNTLYFLRFVVEEGVTDDELREALEGVVAVARKQAGEWKCAKVDTWNPNGRVKNIAEQIGGKYVTRETDSIASLIPFGDLAGHDIEWLANEKYAWC